MENNMDINYSGYHTNTSWETNEKGTHLFPDTGIK